MSLWFAVPFRAAAIYGGYAMYKHFGDEDRRYNKAKNRAIEQLVTEALKKENKKM